MEISECGTMVRAVQGHSLKYKGEPFIDPMQLLREIVDPSEVVEQNESGRFECVHGTSRKRIGGNIKRIKNEEEEKKEEKLEEVGEEKIGLSRMSRDHVHMAPQIVAKSGMRFDSDILIWVNMVGAMEAGIRFFVSANGVILSPGNKYGVIPSRFLRVEYL
jgi:RNA:NAD 2'-phosphotransferase (TPT1/KptA family)